MFTTTFYSYKGGVGRTMALVNVAAELTRRGKRVLIIDFDLEAPGVPSFDSFSASAQSRGIVDFLTEYLKTSAAPNVSDYITEATIENDGESRNLWILPAGLRDENYGMKLASIDWQELYEFRSGYLLFEDLKQQLESDPRKFDYILIDSRTGHTDVGGICTRQLADEIVFMFFPNSQNISGLQSIVQEVRQDPGVELKETKLLFCPSNVPDLDDEDNILKNMLASASKTLGYEKPSATIRHYNSLLLVEQKIFVLDRPRTKLADEYRALTDAVARENLKDIDGALLALHQIRKEVAASTQRGGDVSSLPAARLGELLKKLASINTTHRSHGEICWRVASIYHDLGEFANELEALNGAIDAGHHVSRARLSRAFNLLSQSRGDEAKPDLLAVVSSPLTDPLEFKSAIEALRFVDSSWAEAVTQAPVLDKLGPEDILVFLDSLMSTVDTLPIVKRLIEKAVQATDLKEMTRRVLNSTYTLALVGSGDFRKAIQFLNRHGGEVGSGQHISDLFNLAMAEWGVSQKPPKELLERVIQLSDTADGNEQVNFNQCLALASAVLGRTDEALEYLRRAKDSIGPSSVFSCWSYLQEGPSQISREISEMRILFRQGDVTPPFLKREPDRLH